MKKCLLQSMTASYCSVTINHFQSGLRILFRTFFRNKNSNREINESFWHAEMGAVAAHSSAPDYLEE